MGLFGLCEIIDTKKPKSGIKASTCVFISYSLSCKPYRSLNLENNVMIESLDAIFVNFLICIEIMGIKIIIIIILSSMKDQNINDTKSRRSKRIRIEKRLWSR